MAARPDPKPNTGAWVVISAVLAGVTSAILGSIGFFFAAFGVGTSCDEVYSPHAGARCAVAHDWITTGAIGQWVLVAAACVLPWLALKRLRPHRAAALASFALMPVSIILIVVTTTIADRSF